MLAALMMVLSLGGTVQAKAKPACPNPNFININLKHPIDKGVYKRTSQRCRRLYKQSPCLIMLRQSKRGAFQAICGSRERESPELAKEIFPKIPDYQPNCSEGLFQRDIGAASATEYLASLPRRAEFCSLEEF